MKAYIEQNKDRFFDELFSLLRIPSVSAQPEHRPDMLRCAERLRDLLLEAGADVILVSDTTMISDKVPSINCGVLYASSGPDFARKAAEAAATARIR